MRRAAALCVLTLAFAYAANGQCNLPAASIELASLPYAGIPTVLRLQEQYGSGAAIGTATATITGNHIEVTQTNDIAPTLPTITCREQFLDLGPLAPGDYDVTWTTTEITTLPFPGTRTRVRTLSFSILPASAIPVDNDALLFSMALALTAIAVLRLAR